MKRSARAIGPVWAISAWCALGAACGSDTRAPVPARVDRLPEGVAARVGDESIPSLLVVRVAARQKITPAAARELLIENALFAEQARHALSGSGIVTVAERATLSRSLLERLQSDARSRGEPTDDEIRKIVEARWLELDRPAAVKTSHAVVLRGEGRDDQRARRTAERIARALRGVRDAAQFRRLAAGVPSEGAEVRVEQLPAVTADGRVIPDQPERAQKPQHFDRDFAVAANALDDVGSQSDVVKSAQGYHVILLEQRLPERRVPFEQCRTLLRDEALAARARALESELVARLARATRIEIDRSAEALTAEIRVRP